MTLNRLGTLAAFGWLSATLVRAQPVEVKWSQPMKYDNRDFGYFDGFEGSGRKFIYARFSNLAFSPGRRNLHVTLKAFNRVSMEQEGNFSIVDRSKAGAFRHLRFTKAVVCDTIVFVACTLAKRDSNVLFIRAFSERLHPLTPFLRISVARDSYRDFVVTGDREGNLFVGREYFTDEDNRMKVEYKYLDAALRELSSGILSLPVPVWLRKRERGDARRVPGCTYELLAGGNLYIHDDASSHPDESGENFSHGKMVVRAYLEHGSWQEYLVGVPGKRIISPKLTFTSRDARVVGFFSDYSKDETGSDIHGIFSVSLGRDSLQPGEPRLAWFGKRYLDDLYAGDKDRLRRISLTKPEHRASKEESLDPDYVIDQVAGDTADAFLFCSATNNWSSLVCTGIGPTRGCTDYLYCTRRYVTVFRTDPRGDIVWASNLDRVITYDRWNVNDVRAVRTGGDFLVTYGSAYQPGSRVKNRRTRKSSRQMADRFEYAVFDARSGDYTKHEYQVNRPGSRTERYVSADDVQVLGNRMYTSSIRSRLKPSVYFTILFPPAFYFMILSGNSYRAQGSLGVISETSPAR
jgi:hypothetical protein